jgi:hypothetical protein
LPSAEISDSISTATDDRASTERNTVTSATSSHGTFKDIENLLGEENKIKLYIISGKLNYRVLLGSVSYVGKTDSGDYTRPTASLKHFCKKLNDGVYSGEIFVRPIMRMYIFCNPALTELGLLQKLRRYGETELINIATCIDRVCKILYIITCFDEGDEGNELDIEIGAGLYEFSIEGFNKKYVHIEEILF